MCKILNISTSGYYVYLNHKPSKRELDDMNIIVDQKRVHRLMRETGIKGKHPRKKHWRYKILKEQMIKENLLKQDFSAKKVNETWGSFRKFRCIKKV